MIRSLYESVEITLIGKDGTKVIYAIDPDNLCIDEDARGSDGFSAVSVNLRANVMSKKITNT